MTKSQTVNSISPQQQLFLKLVGIDAYDITNRQLVLGGIAFRVKKELEDYVSHLKDNRYLLYIRIDFKINKEQEVIELSNTLNNQNENIIGTIVLEDYAIIIAECVDKFVEDWDKAKKGKYKELSPIFKMDMKSSYPGAGWDAVFEASKEQIIKHIEKGLSRDNRTPLERKDIAEQLYNSLEDKDSYQLLKKPKFNYV